MFGALLAVACGPEVGGGGEDGGTGSSSTGADASTGSSNSSSGVEVGCFEVVYGSLLLDEETDLEWLSTVREVTGQLTVNSFGGTRDLRELRCLDTVGGAIDIRRNPDLESLAGMEMLREIGDILFVTENPRLKTLDLPVEKVCGVQIASNPNMESIGLANVRSIDFLSLGSSSCPDFPEPGAVPTIVGDNPLLKNVEALQNLEEAVLFIVAGQSGFVSTGGIVETTEAFRRRYPDKQYGVQSEFLRNPSLSESEVSKVFEAEGRESYGANQACENRDDDRECTCFL